MRAIKRHIIKFHSATGSVTGQITLMHASGDGGTEIIVSGANPGFSTGDAVYIDSNGKSFSAGIRNISSNPYEYHVMLDAGKDYNKIIYNQMIIKGGTISKAAVQSTPDTSMATPQADQGTASDSYSTDTTSVDNGDGSGMITPDQQPVTQDMTVKKTTNASSVVLIILLAGVALFGFNKVN
jgi:hypothetical protein